MNLKIVKELDYSYVLKTICGKEVGRIDAVHSDNQVEIIRFCIAIKYRGSKKRYGKKLLDFIIAQSKKDNVKSITVIPKAEEIYDEIEQMELCDLYRKYLNLGFKFKEKDILKSYGNLMYIEL